MQGIDEQSFAVDTAGLMAALTVQKFDSAQLAAMLEGDCYADTVQATGFDPTAKDVEG